MTRVERRRMRAVIDLAIEACEAANLNGSRRPARWVLDLVAGLLAVAGQESRRPADTIEALGMLFDLQGAYLRTPVVDRLAEAHEEVAMARRAIRRLTVAKKRAENDIENAAGGGPGKLPGRSTTPCKEVCDERTRLGRACA